MEEKLNLAYELGVEAFKRGDKPIPFLNQELLNDCTNEISYMCKWIDGYCDTKDELIKWVKVQTTIDK